MTSAKKKKRKKTTKGIQTKVILIPEGEPLSENEEDEDEGGMFLEKEDIQIIYNSLRGYKPTEEEEHLYSVLLEQFEEILVSDYDEPYPDTN